MISIPGGPALGIDEDSEYPEERFTLSAGQVLLLYTDGITDAENRDREFFSEERLIRKLPELAGRSAEEVRDELHRTVRDFAGGAPQSDDITLLTLRLKGVGADD